jgi:hypothetical protein
LPPQPASLPDGKLRIQLCLHQPSQGEIQVVAAQQQMLADRRARELDPVAIAMHADQCKVARAAAHIAHQHQLSVEQALLRLREVIGDPGVERRGRFFHQRQLFDSSVARSLDGELARFFIKRGRHRQNDFLIRQRIVWMPPIPGLADLRQHRARNFHGRENAPAFLRIPR